MKRYKKCFAALAVMCLMVIIGSVQTHAAPGLPVSKKKIRLYYPLSKQLEAMKQAAALRKDHIVETVPYQAEDITIEEVAI